MKESTKAAIERYLYHGLMPGSFLTAVLENNLFEAFATADRENRADLFEICHRIYNDAPSGAWGSKEKVRDFLGADDPSPREIMASFNAFRSAEPFFVDPFPDVTDAVDRIVGGGHPEVETEGGRDG